MNKEDKPLVIEEYFRFRDEYIGKYGPKTVVLLQAGSFYEIYSRTKDDPYINDIAVRLFQINIAKYSTTKEEAYMAGFQDYTVKKYIDRAISEDYKVVLVDQIGPKNIKGGYDKREVTKVITKSNVDIFYDISSNDSKYICSIYLEDHITMFAKRITSCGIAILDINTGNSHVYEFNSQLYDVNDEAYRFIEIFNPLEIIFHSKNYQGDLLDKIKGHRKIYNEYYANYYNIFKLDFQESLLRKIYKNCGMISPISFIGLDRKYSAVNAFVSLLQYSYEHVFNIIEKIKMPKIYEYDEYFILYNNALYQLDIIPRNKKSSSLYDIINRTSTAIGRRMLKEKLLNPIKDSNKLNKLYELNDIMLDHEEEFEKELRKIIDLEKYFFKLRNNKLLPEQFAILQNTLIAIENLIKLHNQYYNKNPIINEFDEFNKFKDIAFKHFNFEMMKENDNNNIKDSFYVKGLYKDIDELQEKIDKNMSELRKKTAELNFIAKDLDKNSKGKGKDKDLVKLEYIETRDDKKNKKKKNNNFGNYYIVCKQRISLLLKKHDKDLQFSNVKSELEKISNNELNMIYKNLLEDMNQLSKRCKEEYENIIKLLNELDLNKIIEFIGNIDIIKSNCLCKKKYGYVKPIIKENGENPSYMFIKDMRHPIAERLELNTNFVPNDITLGINNQNGMLIYGMNSSGKSVTMKSVGVNIILAQCGMYVAASYFEYQPYHNIFTRMSGEDNIFYGKSSFTIELDELRPVIKNSFNRSIVLGDEICRGTESISAIALVGATLRKLDKLNCSYIFATHLHDLTNLDEIKELKKLNICHIKTTIDENKRIIYHRKLLPGPGDTLYGLEVANYLLNDDELIKDAYAIRNKLLNQSQFIIQPKSSSYNKKVYVHECAICKTLDNLDVHHIKFQCNSNDFGLIEHVEVHSKSNLVVLCKKHHLDVHQDKLIINGYLDTSDGPILDHRYVTNEELDELKKSKLKFNEDQVNIIKTYIEKYEKPIKIIDKLKSEKNIEISKNTLKKITNNEYLKK